MSKPPAFLSEYKPPKEGCKTRIMLDSGAFSSWTNNVEISIKNLCEFIRKHHQYIETAINLDVIPGAKGRSPKKEEIELAAEEGWRNFIFMEEELSDLDVELMPVFHIGEDFKWLQLMLDHGCTYIGLGGVAKVKTSVRKKWLDEVFTYLCDENGWPRVKIHGLGVTKVSLILRYPWYSVDSTSWVMTGAFGSIYVPHKYDGEYRYDLEPKVVSISSESPDGKKSNTDHYNNYSKAMQDYVREYVESLGKSIDEVANDVYSRAFINTTYFVELQKSIKPKPFKVTKRGGFFG